LLWSLLAVVTAVYVPVAIWGLSAGPNDPSNVVWAFVIVPSFVGTGVILMLKRPRHPIGELLLASGIVLWAIPTILEIPTVAIFERSGAQNWMWGSIWVFETLTNVGVVLFVTLLALLPDGRFRYARERRFLLSAWVVVAFPTLVMISNQFMVTGELSFAGVSGIPSPLFVAALEPYGQAFDALNALGYLIVVGAIALLFMRYRSAPIRERKQIRWVLLAGVMAILLGSIAFVLPEFGVIPPPEHDFSVLTVVSALIPIILIPASVVIAVLEPVWVDVDIVVRKSIVYGALSFVILLVYIGVASAFGVAAGTRLGLSVETAVVVTVLVAVLFQPARRRLQAVADRWVFGARPSKYEAVTEFGVTVEQAAEPTELLPQLVETIQRAIRLRWAKAILDDGTQAETGLVAGEPALRVPLGAGDERIGEIVCGPKAEGAIQEDEIQLVRTLAGQLGLALMNARLAGRIVNAAEAERRRIERNIHDGAQQELVALVARLGMARSAAATGGLSAKEIDDLRLEAQQILSDLRELAQGIHPSVLSDGGLLEAVEDRCARIPLDVSVECPTGLRVQRFHDEIEGAAYFFVTEALTNVLKHADATRAAVSLTQDQGRLLLRVTDDGRGFNPDTASQNGLAGLRDRIRALGGTVTIASRPGEGSRISASLPVDQP
jgi:signal transduction histidine kinase